MTDQQKTVVYDENIMITMRGVSDSIGLPYTVNPLELVDREALIELREGPSGGQGPEGEPARPWRWRGDIADVAALKALNLGTPDARSAWRVTSENAVYYWTGLDFIAFDNAFLRPGKPGPANALSGAAVAGEPGSAAAARIIGTAPGQTVEITFPRGIPGDAGDPGGAGKIQDAADVLIDQAHPIAQDYVLMWNASLGKFAPVANPKLGGPWAIGKGQFSSGSNLNVAKTVAAITIPGQPTAWRPQVRGSLRVASANPNSWGGRSDVEVRIGDPSKGELVGYGYGYNMGNWDWVLIGPKFEYPLSPSASFGVVQPNQTITLYVTAKNTLGGTPFSVDNTGAQLIVYAERVL
ncbi:hypothetical protein ACFXHA_21795 [Nocardia sp. NPDC059240]|uniref:hypothetical protein n=1 Tax=Nocardia sp. NPDC059240 TaxID=3346786 RepID=UPI0036B5E2E0